MVVGDGNIMVVDDGSTGNLKNRNTAGVDASGRNKLPADPQGDQLFCLCCGAKIICTLACSGFQKITCGWSTRSV